MHFQIVSFSILMVKLSASPNAALFMHVQTLPAAIKGMEAREVNS